MTFSKRRRFTDFSIDLVKNIEVSCYQSPFKYTGQKEKYKARVEIPVLETTRHTQLGTNLNCPHACRLQRSRLYRNSVYNTASCKPQAAALWKRSKWMRPMRNGSTAKLHIAYEQNTAYFDRVISRTRSEKTHVFCCLDLLSIVY